MMKKLLSLILCVLCLPFGVFAQVDNAISLNLSEIEFVEASGIIGNNYFTDGKAIMSRGELVTLIVDFMEYDKMISSYNGEQVFFDVEPTESFFAGVCVAAKLGICSGHENGLFKPYEEATVLDAVTMILNAIGLSDLCKSVGYPAGYVKFADTLGITDDIKSVLNEKLTFEIAIKCLYNTLFSPYAETTYGQKLTYDGNETTYAYKKHKIAREIGVVTATPYARVGSLLSPAFKIEIDGKLYSNPNRYGENFIGQSVEFYYKEGDTEGDNVILYISSDEGNDVITISADDAMYSLDNLCYLYYKENKAKEYRAKVSYQTQFVLNGIPVDNITEDSVDPEDGFITLIDNNCDGTYDYVNIESYETVVVGAVNTEDKYIYDNFSGKTHDYSNIDEEAIIILDADKNELSFDDIAALDVLTLAKSEEVLKIYHSSKIIEDTPESLRDYNDYEEVDFSYGKFITTDYYDKYSDLKINMAGKEKYHFDFLNRIVFLSRTYSSENNVAFLFTTMSEENEKAFKIKYLDADGNFVVSQLADNVKIDGKKCVNSDEIKDRIYDGSDVINELVLLKKNENGEITSIETAYSLNGDGTLVNQINKTDTKPDGLYVSYETPGEVSYYNTNSFLGYGPFYDDALIIVIDVDGNNNIKTSTSARHFVTSPPYMLKSVKYTAKTYKFSKDDSAASVVVLRVDSDKASFSNSNSQIGLVNRVTEVLADDMSTVVHKLYCIVNGNNQSFITVNSKLAEGISAGDLIRYNLDPNTKQIIALERTFDESRRVIGNHGGSYSSNYRSIYMPVYSVNGDYVALAKEDTLEGSIEDLLETYRIKTNSIIFKFDSQSKEFKKIQPSDIKSYKNHPADYDKMYLCTAAGNAKVFVVYENDNNEIVE